MREATIQDEIPQRAVSIYGQNDGVDDFPVLKAFQQYIDAEQDKARKRVLGLSVFFFVILAIVVAVFLVLMNGINTRNQALSDRLVEYAMKESERRAAVQPEQQPRHDDQALKVLSETLATLQKKIESDATQKAADQKKMDEDRRREAREDIDRMQQEKTLLEAERKKIAEERERLRQIEIDQQRRKLYPDLYEGNRERKVSSGEKRSLALTDDDIRDIIREAYSRKVSPSSPTKSETDAASDLKADEDADLPDDAIEYFKDDEYNIPVDVKNSSSRVRFTIPVGD